jgi:hypothetical protein
MIRGSSAPINRRVGRAVFAPSALLPWLIVLPAPAGANHTNQQASTPEGDVCGFITDRDVLLNEFGLVVGDFNDDRLNRALTMAGREVLASTPVRGRARACGIVAFVQSSYA